MISQVVFVFPNRLYYNQAFGVHIMAFFFLLNLVFAPKPYNMGLFNTTDVSELGAMISTVLSGFCGEVGENKHHK